SRPPGALTKAPHYPGRSELQARGPASSPGPVPPQVPRGSQRGPRGRPRSSLQARTPATEPDTGFRRSRPEVPAPSSSTSSQRRRPQPRALLSFPLFCHCLSCVGSPFSHLTPTPSSVSPAASPSVSPPPSPAPLLLKPCAASHIPRINTRCHPRLAGARGFERAVGGEGTHRAPAPPPPPLSSGSAAPRLGLAGGDVPH
ncbi:hypothetical protein H1C71_017202, partial [Ictidomys tridecemlineatus]